MCITNIGRYFQTVLLLQTFFSVTKLKLVAEFNMALAMLMWILGPASSVAHVQPGHLVILLHWSTCPRHVVRHGANGVGVERRRWSRWNNDISQLSETEGGEWLLWQHRADAAGLLSVHLDCKFLLNTFIKVDLYLCSRLVHCTRGHV